MSLEYEVKKGGRLSRKEAEEYLQHEARWAPAVAGGVTMCILSPVILILLTCFSAMGLLPMTPGAAGGMGIVLLLLMVTWAVTLFVRYSMASHDYDLILEDRFTLGDGVEEIIRRKKRETGTKCTKQITWGTAVCILAVIPLLAAAFTGKDSLVIAAVIFLLCAVSFGVNLLVRCGMVWDSYERLLRDGDYSSRLHGSLSGKIGSVYWPLAAAVYLIWSFASGNWVFTWVLWPAAGLLFAAVTAVCRMMKRG